MRLAKLFIIVFLLTGSLSQLLAQGTRPQSYSRSTAQLGDRFPHIIKVNFLSPFVLTANVAYEQFITPNLSFQLGAYYNGISLNERDFYWFSILAARYRSFAITPEVRYYTGDPARPALNGLYLAPFARYQNTGIRITPEQHEQNDVQDSQNRTYEGNLNAVRIGGVAGYKFLIGDHFSFEVFAGPSLRLVSWLNANLDTYNLERFRPFGLTLRSGMTIGYVF